MATDELDPLGPAPRVLPVTARRQATRPIRVLCVDDHPVVREGVASIIGREADMEVVARADDGRAAIEAYDRVRPDVTLMDLRLPRMSGVEAIRAIRRRDAGARIVAMTMFDADEALAQARDAGAAAYVLKDSLVDTLVTVVREVCTGRDAGSLAHTRPSQV